MIQYKVDFKGIPWESPIAGMRQKIHKAGSRQLRLVEYAKELTPHWCEKGHMGYVLQGAIEIQFENEVRIYSSGDGISIPHGQEHRHLARVLSDTVMVIFVEDV